jgi:serine/threonine-protein kinase HipA
MPWLTLKSEWAFRQAFRKGSVLLDDHRLPYPKQVDLRWANLAMKIGGSYRLQEIGSRNWEKFARENKLNQKILFSRIAHLLEELPQKCRVTADLLRAEGITHPVIDLLVKAISDRVTLCQKEFGR